MKRTALITTILAGSVAATTAQAAAELSGGITVIAQSSNDDRIKSAHTSSVDFGIAVKQGKGEWNFAFEAASSVRSNTVAGTLGEANGDAGSAADTSDRGRVQLSGIEYAFPTGLGRMTVGVIDLGAFLDGSSIANDETSQFISAGLINNATIGFPDYTIGIALSKEAGKNNLGYSIVLANSHGLGDNPKKSFSELVRFGDGSKGLWLGAEVQQLKGNRTYRYGGWISTADNDRLDTGTANNYGIYTSIDGGNKDMLWNFRAGIANDKVSQGTKFLSYAIQMPWKSHTIGAGISWTGISNVGKTATQDDMIQAEVYLAWEVNKRVVITPSLQWIKNSGFDASGSSFDKNQTVLSVRMQYNF